MRQTLPAGTRGWPWGVDVIRKVIRQTPALHLLGERVGSTKAYTEAELALIRRAVEERDARRAAPAA